MIRSKTYRLLATLFAAETLAVQGVWLAHAQVSRAVIGQWSASTEFDDDGLLTKFPNGCIWRTGRPAGPIGAEGNDCAEDGVLEAQPQIRISRI